jgi:death-on-curing protein
MPRFIQFAEALEIHDQLIALLGGSAGLRDAGLLESALSQPQATFFGELLHPTISSQAAAYLFHIAKNHPFVDGNKRTALTIMLTFLEVNDCVLTLSQQELFDLVLAVATGQMSKEAIAQKIEDSLAH